MDQGETTKQEINYIGFMVYLFCQMSCHKSAVIVDKFCWCDFVIHLNRQVIVSHNCDGNIIFIYKTLIIFEMFIYKDFF